MAMIIGFLLMIACLFIFFFALPAVLVYSLILSGLYKITLLLIAIMVACCAISSILGVKDDIFTDRYTED